MMLIDDNANWIPELVGARKEIYGADILDSNEMFLFTLPYDPGDGSSLEAGLTSGSISYNLDSRITVGAQLSLINTHGLINWMSYRIRPWVIVNDIKWNLGVFIPTSPDDDYDSDSVKQDVTLMGKTSILDADALDAILSIPAGDVVIPWVEQIILDSTGESLTGITPSDKTLASPMTWPANTSKLDVINDLLGSIAYNNLWCDNDGLWRAEEWVDPASQVPTVKFEEGDISIHSPSFKVSQNTTGVPNKVICTTAGDDQNVGLVSVVTNEDPNSPYSYQARGGIWIAKVYDSVEAADQETLDKIAARNLKLNMTPPWYVDVEHATVPLEGRQVLQFTSNGIDRQVSVNEWVVTLTPGSLMTGKWLGVNS